MKRSNDKTPRYALRKYAIGLASVLVGTGISPAISNHVQAQEVESKTSLASYQGEAVADDMPMETEDRMVSAWSNEVLLTSSTEETAISTNSSNDSVETESQEPATTGQASSVQSASTSEGQVSTSLVGSLASSVSTSTDQKPTIEPADTRGLTAEVPTTKQTESIQELPSLPPQGSYTYTVRTNVKNTPSAEAPVAFYVDAGDRVNYDQVLEKDGFQWLSYISYSGVRRYAAINDVTFKGAKPIPEVSKETGKPSLPSQGRYVFQTPLPVKASANMTDETIYEFQKGESIYYDQLVTQDAHEWLSYITYTGKRRYIPYKALPVKADKVKDTKENSLSKENQVSGDLEVSSNQSNSFKVTVSNVKAPQEIKAVRVPVWSQKGGQDDIVWYTATPKGDGKYTLNVDLSHHAKDNGSYHIHLYYQLSNGQLLGVSGTTYTVAESPSLKTKSAISAQGKYYFDATKEVKNKPEQKAPTEFVFNKGDSVFYDKVLAEEGRQWISYISYNGLRRYVDLGVYTRAPHTIDKKEKIEKETLIKPADKTERLTKSYQQDTPVTSPNQLKIEKVTPTGFEVTIRQPRADHPIKSIKVPVWSDNNGQDDLKWYDAKEKTNGDYTVDISLSNHHGETGVYHVHLYYQLATGQLKGIDGTTITIDASKPDTTSLNATPNTHSNPTKTPSYNGSYYSIQGKYGEVIVVNKKYPLASDYQPGEQAHAKKAFDELRQAMRQQGLAIGTNYSGFRSYSYQDKLYQYYVSKDGQAAADRYSARAGHSEHQTGLAFDLTEATGGLLQNHMASSWLAQNAHRYGFVVRYLPDKENITGYMPESWHIRYIGQEATDIYKSGLSLEEYYGFEGGGYGKPSNQAISRPQSPKVTQLPPKGTYTFTEIAYIKANPSLNSPHLAYYAKGDQVNYDQVIEAEGRTWLSYLAYSGARRYIAIR